MTPTSYYILFAKQVQALTAKFAVLAATTCAPRQWIQGSGFLFLAESFRRAQVWAWRRYADNS